MGGEASIPIMVYLDFQYCIDLNTAGLDPYLQHQSPVFDDRLKTEVLKTFEAILRILARLIAAFHRQNCHLGNDCLPLHLSLKTNWQWVEVHTHLCCGRGVDEFMTKLGFRVVTSVTESRHQLICRSLEEFEAIATQWKQTMPAMPRDTGPAMPDIPAPKPRAQIHAMRAVGALMLMLLLMLACVHLILYPWL